MLTKEDHPKVTGKKLHMNMITGQIAVEKNESIPDSDSNLEIQFGKYHYKRIDNGVVDQEFTVPVVVKSLQDLTITMEQLKRQILYGEIQITIEKIVTYNDDVPSPTESDIEKAIRISEESNPIEIEIPETQSIDSPSWD